MRCPDKVTALHSLTQRIVFANATYCVFLLTTHLSVMLNLFNFVQFAHARHSSSKLVSALAQSQISASHREPLLFSVLGQILKQFIRLRLSKTSYIFFIAVR